MAVQTITERKPSEPMIRAGAPGEAVQTLLDALSRRAFSIFEENGRLAGNDWSDWFRAERELFHPTLLQVAETGDAFTVRAEVPGFAPKDLDINVEGRRLTISGLRTAQEERKDKTTVYSEVSSDRIFRVMDLPAEVKPESAKASLKDGVLELELPKAAPAKQVAIKTEKAA
jgi:HSP20 family protein